MTDNYPHFNEEDSRLAWPINVYTLYSIQSILCIDIQRYTTYTIHYILRTWYYLLNCRLSGSLALYFFDQMLSMWRAP